MSKTWLDRGLLGRIRKITRPWRCHLVGGAVRDHLLGRAIHDLDLLVGGGDPVVSALAAQLPARKIEIGGDRFAAIRLVGVDDDGSDFEIDVWDRGETPLEQELARRDLTINSLALDLADGALTDPFAGGRDIAVRRLRATTDTVFADDPLRVLRLARFAAELDGFAVEPATRELARSAIDGLERVASERQREELTRTLVAERPEAAIALWAEIGFLSRSLAVDSDLATAGAASVRTAIERARGCRALLPPEVHADRFTLHAATLLTALDRDIAMLFELGLISKRQARGVALVLPHRRLPAESAEQRWLLYRAAEQWPAALCHAAAWDPSPTDAAERAASIAALAVAEGDSIFNPQPLVRGDEIRRQLAINTGPEIGVAAKRLRRLQVEGRITRHDQALDWLLNEHRSSTAD